MTREDIPTRLVRPGTHCKPVTTGLSGPIARAYTLVELLVAIAIIAVLMGVLLPALGRTRDGARQAACLSNQHQIGVALNTYATTFKDIIPRESGASEGPRGPQVAAYDGAPVNISWAFSLRPMLDDRASATSASGGVGDGFAGCPVYRDPARPRDEHRVNYVANGLRFRSADAVGNDGKPPSPIHRVARPEGTFYLTCLSDAPFPGETCPTPDGSTDDLELSTRYDVWVPVHVQGYSQRAPSLGQIAGLGRHAHGANVLFMDAHAVLVSAERVRDPFAWDDGDYR
ncbi:hypothetical protein PHYC_02223 [Phycisphaerales bacterium]|nr:hypothetical protein PHYC_02223 [Phycisphaerales bacterium]